jgi:hypothetical protein
MSENTAVSSLVADLPTVDLDELNATAGLLIRRDRKYPCHVSDLNTLLTTCPPGTRVLNVDGRRNFDYRTLYYDTCDFTAYYLTARQRRRRFKLRLRQQGPGLPVWLEAKTRGLRGITVKDRLGFIEPTTTGFASQDTSLPTPDDNLMGLALSTLNERGVRPPSADQLVPTLEVRYHRTTMLLPDGSRATIDSDVSWGRPGDTLLVIDGLVIIETKTPGQASLWDKELWSTGRRPAALSKFGVGMAQSYPELSANRWHRLIAKYSPTRSVSEGAPLLAVRLGSPIDPLNSERTAL